MFGVNVIQCFIQVATIPAAFVGFLKESGYEDFFIRMHVHNIHVHTCNVLLLDNNKCVHCKRVFVTVVGPEKCLPSLCMNNLVYKHHVE